MSTEQTTVRVAEAIEIVKADKVTGTFLVGDKVTVGLKDLTKETGVAIISGRIDSIHRLDSHFRIDTSAEFNACVQDVKLTDVVDMVAYGATIDAGVKQEDTPVPTSTPTVTATPDEHVAEPVATPVVTPVVTPATDEAEVAEKAAETPVVAEPTQEAAPVVTPLTVDASATGTAFQADAQTATIPEGITEVK